MDTPEQLARKTIDAQLGAAGWSVQSLAELNLAAVCGIALREMQTYEGHANYVLFVDGQGLGIVEAKKEGTSLATIAEQSARYTAVHKWIPQRWVDTLPFTYEHLEKRVLTTDPVKTLTNLITLVRHTVYSEKTPLAPFPELLNARFDKRLYHQQNREFDDAAHSPLNTENLKLKTSRFSQSQIHWLKVIRYYVALSGAFATDDQDAYLDAWQSVYSDKGVPLAVANPFFGKDVLKPIIEALNEVLVA